MLVLSRKVGERILIGDHIAVTIVRVTGGGVRVGIEAPSDMAVLRAEIKAATEHSAGATEPIKASSISAESLRPESARVESLSADPIGPTLLPLSTLSETKSAVVVKPFQAEVGDPPSDVPPIRKPR